MSIEDCLRWMEWLRAQAPSLEELSAMPAELLTPRPGASVLREYRDMTTARFRPPPGGCDEKE